jgi:hypothetical protein
MENLRRLGGEAGVLAGLAMAWMILGFVFIFPSAGLALSDQANPHRYLPFIARHSALFWSVNILGGLVAGLMGVMVFMALWDRFKEDAPASAKIGSLIGIVGAGMFAASVVVRQVGLAMLSPMYAANTVGASHAFYAVHVIVSSLAALGNLALGFGILALGNVLMKHRKYNSLGYLSVVAGVAMVLSGFVAHPITYIAGAASAAAWLIWTALVLRSEAGPALFRWGVTKSRPIGRAHAQKRVA